MSDKAAFVSGSLLCVQPLLEKTPQVTYVTLVSRRNETLHPVRRFEQRLQHEQL